MVGGCIVSPIHSTKGPWFTTQKKGAPLSATSLTMLQRSHHTWELKTCSIGMQLHQLKRFGRLHHTHQLGAPSPIFFWKICELSEVGRRKRRKSVAEAIVHHTCFLVGSRERDLLSLHLRPMKSSQTPRRGPCMKRWLRLVKF